MAATLCPVVSRLKQFEQFYSQPSDFGLGPAETVDAHRVIDEPGWSPYCIDDTAGTLVFVRTPANVNLEAAPFHHLEQYLNAEALLTLPLGEVAQLARVFPMPNIALIFSIGRCGTTLISHALAGSDSVTSLSEPGVFEHRPLRALAGNFDVPSLIGDLCRLLFAVRGRAEADMLVVKFRSQALFVAEQFWQALPAARYVFMYRDAVSWGESFRQFLIDVGVPLPPDAAGRDFHWMMGSADAPLSDLARYVDLDQRPIATEAILAPLWPFQLEEYARLLSVGMPFLAVRYNELVADRAGELARIFTHCGIPHIGITRALTAFDEDSQKGTAIARKGDKPRFDAQSRAIYLATLARNPPFSDPDLILPDIYTHR
ncbi:MAG: hypothetical protein ACTHNL_06665 [Devosia sp.]